MSSNVMSSSCPDTALVVGVKIGAGSLSASRTPGGSATPHTSPRARYDFSPEPAR